MVSIEEWCAASVRPRCLTCGVVLNVSVATRDCGGDCLRCMAASGDPDCKRALGIVEVVQNAVFEPDHEFAFKSYTDDEPLSMSNFPW